MVLLKMKIFQTRVFQVAKLYDRMRELAEELQKATIIKFEKTESIPTFYRLYWRC